MGKQWKEWETLFLGAPKSPQMVTATMKLKDACSLVWGCLGWRRPGPGFRFPLKWWDSPPPSGNLEPANQHAPSKKKGTYQGKAESPRTPKFEKSPGRFGPIRLLCKHVTNLFKPATNCLGTPYKLGNSLGSALSDPVPLRWMRGGSPDSSQQ